MEYAIRLKNINKYFGKNNHILNNINMEVKKGIIFGIVGKNGAGKTTTMKIMTGLLKETSGSVEIGKGLTIGSLIETPGICGDMTGLENLKLKATAIGNIPNEKLNEILELVGLDKYEKRKAKNYSLGMKQRLGIALALVGDPDILVLDEPINGLDPEGIVEIRNLILNLRDKYGKTILISSHILEELFKIGDEYVIIDNGEVLLQATYRELKERLVGEIEVLTDDVDKLIKLLADNGVNKYSIENQAVLINKNEIEISKLAKMMVENNIKIDGISHKSIAYENLFFSLIKKKKIISE